MLNHCWRNQNSVQNRLLDGFCLEKSMARISDSMAASKNTLAFLSVLAGSEGASNNRAAMVPHDALSALTNEDWGIGELL